MDIYEEKRPWGIFRRLTNNQISTVKILTVKAGEEFSLQYHQHRDEFWRILSGEPEVTIGDEIKRASSGDEFFIPKEIKHRIKSLQSDTVILEISLGDFDEHDIIRLQDKYGRP